MIKAKKQLVWFLMLVKRLLCKKTFVILLCLIPVLVPATHSVLQNSKSSILEIALCNPDNDPATEKIIKELTSDEDVISYTITASAENAETLVKSGKVDAAWIFTPELDKKASRAVSGIFKIPLVSVIQQEDTIPLRLSREVLHGAMYSRLSYAIFENFIFEDMQLKGKVSENALQSYYNNEERLDDIILQKPLYENVNSAGENLLTAPLRGMVALLVVLCTLASVLFFLKDRKEGRFSWLSPEKQIVPAFACCLSAAVLSGITVFITFQLSGINSGFFRELISIIFFILGTTGFCLVLCVLFPSPGILGAALPGIIIGMLLSAPIFFNLAGTSFIKWLLPMNYYLYSLYDPGYFPGFAIYCVSSFLIAYVINRIKTKIIFN